MKSKQQLLYSKLKEFGLNTEQERKVISEVFYEGTHDTPEAAGDISSIDKSVYLYHDFSALQNITAFPNTYVTKIKSIDELLERDKQREQDGFPRKIRVGRLIKPGKGNKDQVVVVQTTVEEKFIHDTASKSPEEDYPSGGSGDGEEGEIIGEQPIRTFEDGQGAGPGQGDGAPHEIESSAYDLGKILTEKFELPNLKDKGKKRSLTRYTYDLTDKNRGFGQVLDKKATLRKIVESNISLGNLPDLNNIDSTKFLVSPRDKVYRVLSKEKDYESQAMIFFLRDYSASMIGKPTELVVTQHVLIYSWLLYQYAGQVESRFILHDTDATEVADFYTYYNSKVAGGTQVSSAYHLVNEIVEKENLIQDYNIFIFHGTDGDDWDTNGVYAIPELKKMLSYASRIGVSIAKSSSGSKDKSEVEKYLIKSRLLEEKADFIRLDVIQDDADEPRLIEGIKKLIS